MSKSSADFANFLIKGAITGCNTSKILEVIQCLTSAPSVEIKGDFSQLVGALSPVNHRGLHPGYQISGTKSSSKQAFYFSQADWCMGNGSISVNL